MYIYIILHDVRLLEWSAYGIIIMMVAGRQDGNLLPPLLSRITQHLHYVRSGKLEWTPRGCRLHHRVPRMSRVSSMPWTRSLARPWPGIITDYLLQRRQCWEAGGDGSLSSTCEWVSLRRSVRVAMLVGALCVYEEDMVPWYRGITPLPTQMNSRVSPPLINSRVSTTR